MYVYGGEIKIKFLLKNFLLSIIYQFAFQILTPDVSVNLGTEPQTNGERFTLLTKERIVNIFF